MARVDEAGLIKRWQAILPPDLVPDLVKNCRKALAAQGRDSSDGEVAIALQTDRQFRIPAIRVLEGQVRHGKAFHYIFNWKSPMADMGSCHALEVGFVFGNLNPRFHGAGPLAEELSAKMQDAWIGFARTGNPSSQSLGAWPEYGSGRLTMMLGEKCGVERAPLEDGRLAWKSVPDRFLG